MNAVGQRWIAECTMHELVILFADDLVLLRRRGRSMWQITTTSVADCWGQVCIWINRQTEKTVPCLTHLLRLWHSFRSSRDAASSTAAKTTDARGLSVHVGQ
jgi:hypothetical protein